MRLLNSAQIEIKTIGVFCLLTRQESKDVWVHFLSTIETNINSLTNYSFFIKVFLEIYTNVYTGKANIFMVFSKHNRHFNFNCCLL